ncbi:MAG: hypothetical protein JWO67_7423 [Streptosporangiaceae bacterium]|nr:hypothetical protein [Streptosporangiaceae bacterium]
MSFALPAPLDPAECADGYRDVCIRLARFGITTAMAPLPAHKVATYDHATETLWLREDAPMIQKTWSVIEMWKRVVWGPHGSAAAPRAVAPEATTTRRLAVVPRPRASTENHRAAVTGG